MKLPNIWGDGQIFAYSGIDGKTDWYHPFVATTLSDRIGFRFHLKNYRELWGKADKIDRQVNNLVCSDCIDVTVCVKGKGGFNIKYIFVSNDIIIGETYSEIPPVTIAADIVKVKFLDKLTLQSSDDEYTALAWGQNDKRIKFSYAFDSVCIENAIRKAKQALNLDLNKEHKKKIKFFQNLPKFRFQDSISEKTYYKAFSVLKANTESPQGNIKFHWTTPDRFPHRDMWLWDSAFHSLAYKHISSSLGKNAIKAVLFTQRRDGFIPHRMTPKPKNDSSITQPPILSWAVWDVYNFSKNKNFLAHAYPKLKRYILWNLKNRDNNRNGLLEWLKNERQTTNRCDESGMDNSPRFDHRGLDDAVDFNSFMVNEMNCLANIVGVLNKKDDKKMWIDKSKRLTSLINKYLWSKKDGFYYDRNLEKGLIKIKAISSFTPLFAKVADKKQAKAIIKHLTNKKEFWTPFPVPSISQDEPSFSDDMWRGPIWINYNYLIIEGLMRYGFKDIAMKIVKKTLQQIAYWYEKTGLIYEYYDPMAKTDPGLLYRKGKNVGAIRDYNWSAALFIQLLFLYKQLNNNKDIQI